MSRLALLNENGVQHAHGSVDACHRYLHFGANQLNGTVPAGISALTQLAYLNVRANKFSGSFPDGISTLTRLT